MAHIRHRSVKPPMQALLEIRVPSLDKPALQPVTVCGREGNAILVEHPNGWIRVLHTQSGSSDGGVYVETDTRTPGEITYRLLTVEEPTAKADLYPHAPLLVHLLEMSSAMEFQGEFRR